jgi:predicted nucleic acid-binding protein
MILVDSSVWIDYFNGSHNWQVELLDKLLQHEPIIMGDLIFTEVLQGFRSDTEFNLAKKFLSVLPIRTLGGYKVALQSAAHYREMRKKGITVRKTIDLIIATFCIMENIALLHNDHDFDPMAAHLSLQTITRHYPIT